MKLINAIKEGDFVRLRSLSGIINEYNGVKRDHCPIIGGICVMLPDRKDEIPENQFIMIEPNVVNELGHVVRIKNVEPSIDFAGRIWFGAESNGLIFEKSNGNDISFDDRIIHSVLIDGKWYDADMNIDVLL